MEMGASVLCRAAEDAFLHPRSDPGGCKTCGGHIAIEMVSKKEPSVPLWDATRQRSKSWEEPRAVPSPGRDTILQISLPTALLGES